MYGSVFDADGTADAASCVDGGSAETRLCLRHIPRHCYRRGAGTVGMLYSLFL